MSLNIESVGEVLAGATRSNHVELAMLGYETGWDKGWSSADGGYLIEAHAPSIISLKVRAGGCIEVRPIVREGGRRHGIPFVNGRPVALDSVESLKLEDGSILMLEVRLQGSRDGCWNQWLLSGAGIILLDEVRVSFWAGAHLGDSLGMLLACENFGRENRCRVVVRETPLFRDIGNLFVFSWIEVSAEAKADDESPWIHIHPFGYNFEELGWIQGICLALQKSLGGRVPSEIEYPPHCVHPLPDPEAVTLVQFDGRSGGQWQRSTLRRFLRLYEGKRIAVLGGPDTLPYLGEYLEYRVGDLAFIASQLLSCERFVGADSGIAHLACILGLEIEILPAPAVSERLVRGIFGHYPKVPRYRSLAETRGSKACDRSLFLVSTTNGWNLGDDLIRQGVFRLLEIDELKDSVVWLNRCQVDSEDIDRNCPWSPLWKRLRNLGDRRSLAENARALIVAGTPEWIDTMQPFFQLSVTTSLPIWIVGVGGSQAGQTHHLKQPAASGSIRVATVRDEAAKAALANQGIIADRFFDPAFHSEDFTLGQKGEFIFNPRLETRSHEQFYLELFKKFRDRIGTIVVHEPMEHARATNLFERPVFYHSDYRRYIDLYRRCGTYLGGRMHGAIPSLAAGAEVFLICHEGKHWELEWVRGRLDHPEALTLVGETDGFHMHPRIFKRPFDQSRCLKADFEAHRNRLKAAISLH
jgi:hypothetical protein